MHGMYMKIRTNYVTTTEKLFVNNKYSCWRCFSALCYYR